jgi:hypothetical protein
VVRPFIVFAGTQAALIDAEDASSAFTAFVAQRFPDRGIFGRTAPPTVEEAHIRPLRPEDREWLEDCDAPDEWVAALDRI